MKKFTIKKTILFDDLEMGDFFINRNDETDDVKQVVRMTSGLSGGKQIGYRYIYSQHRFGWSAWDVSAKNGSTVHVLDSDEVMLYNIGR